MSGCPATPGENVRTPPGETSGSAGRNVGFSTLEPGENVGIYPEKRRDGAPGGRKGTATGKNVSIKRGKDIFLLCKPRKSTEATGQTIHREKCQDFSAKTTP